jgi:hypothetical protein
VEFVVPTCRVPEVIDTLPKAVIDWTLASIMVVPLEDHETSRAKIALESVIVPAGAPKLALLSPELTHALSVPVLVPLRHNTDDVSQFPVPPAAGELVPSASQKKVVWPKSGPELRTAATHTAVLRAV